MPKSGFQWAISAAARIAFAGWILLLAFGGGYFLIGYWNIAPLFGINWSLDNFFHIVRVASWVIWLLPPLIVLQMIVFFFARHRLIRRAIAHRCHLCPRCGYDLRPRTSDAQPCPECGQRISRREAVRLWARFAGN